MTSSEREPFLLEVPTAGGGTEYVAAYPTDTPGLVVHRSVGFPGWVVTHERSSLLVGFVDNRSEAEALAVALGSVCDWTVSGSDIKADIKRRRAVRGVLREFGVDAYLHSRDDRNASLEAS